MIVLVVPSPWAVTCAEPRSQDAVLRKVHKVQIGPPQPPLTERSTSMRLDRGPYRTPRGSGKEAIGVGTIAPRSLTGLSSRSERGPGGAARWQHKPSIWSQVPSGGNAEAGLSCYP